MKRPLLAAIFLGAFAHPASAQTSVTVWGIMDAWVGRIDNKIGGAPEGKTTVVESGGAQASRWGIRGTEDLGGGLSAKFALESGISIDKGTVTNVSASNSGFNRNAYIALIGNSGELRLGRMLTAYDALRGSNNQLYDSSGFASTGQVWGAGATAGDHQRAMNGSDYLARGNNTVLYKTPKWGPFLASVSVSAGEGATTATDAPRMVTGHVEYNTAAVRFGYAFQDEKYTTGMNRFDMLAGRYTIGSVRIVANYQWQNDQRVAEGQKSKEYQVGVDVPFGLATVAFGYARAVTRDDTGMRLVDANGYSALGTYDLSKRTRLYAALRRLSVERSDGSMTHQHLKYGVGVTHLF